MVDDIVARLRILKSDDAAEYLAWEAADEILRLRNRVSELEQVEATAQLSGLGLSMHRAHNAGLAALRKGCKEERLRAESAEREVEMLRSTLRENDEKTLQSRFAWMTPQEVRSVSAAFDWALRHDK